MKLSDVEALAMDLMQTHGLREWRFKLDRSVRRFGCCHYDAKLITLSAKLSELNTQEQVKETLLHEIAHALAPRGEGHSPIWRALAQSIGCSGSRTYSTAALVLPPKTWKATCLNCGNSATRHRRKRLACGRCCQKHNNGLFTADFLFQWSQI